MSKIKCSSCGKIVDSDAKFCVYCGAPVKKSSGLINRLMNLFISDKSPKQTYDYFLNNKIDVQKFNDNFSDNEYITNELKIKIKKDNETNYKHAKKLKNEINASQIVIDKQDLKLLDSFISNYENIDERVNDVNKYFIDDFYNEFKQNRQKYESFIDKYRTNISYDEIVSDDVEKEFRDDYCFIKKLIDFEKTYNYDFGSDKKLIHDFASLYENFDNVRNEINNEVNRRKNLVKDYEKFKPDILEFIKKYDIESTDVYVKDYQSILDDYNSYYVTCVELNQYFNDYHDDSLSEFISIYDDFEIHSAKINENYLNYRYGLFTQNKSEILNQINQYKNISADDYLENKDNFLEKFVNIHTNIKELLEYDYSFSDDDLVIINDFFRLFDDFNGEFPSKFYKSFSNYSSDLTSFITQYGGDSLGEEYISDKNDVLKDFEGLFEISKDIAKLNNANELNLEDSVENQIKSFIDLFDNFDDVVIKNNSIYVEKLNGRFSNQKESILEFMARYGVDKHLDYYIEDEIKYNVLDDNNDNYELCAEMQMVPEANNEIAAEFLTLYDNFNEIVFEMNKNYVNNLYDSNKDGISEYVSVINLSQDFYVSNSKLNMLCENHNHYLEVVQNLLGYCSNYNYIDDKSLLMEFPINSDEIIQSVPDANESFINRELEENKQLFNNVVKGKPLDENQRRAVIVDEDNTQIIAGAGCGKTLTLQAKAKYLIERKGVNPDEILAISYSKLAQGDLDAKMTEIGADIDVSTFHSLGLNTLRKNNIKSNILEYGLKDAIKEYFLVKIINDVDKIQKIIEYFGYFMYEPLDKEKIRNIGEIYDYERGMDLETLYSKFAKLRDPTLKKTTLQGEKVKSLEERRIANFLFINGIKYSYEKTYEAKIDWQKTHDYLDKIILKDTEIPENIKQDLIYELLDYLELDEVLVWPRGGNVEKYHPDFYLDDYDIYYEHFGVNRKCLAPWLPRKQSREYKKEMRNKRFLHKKYGTKLIETYSYYQSENRLLDRLSEKLLECGVEFKEMDYQQFMIDLLNDEEKINEYWDFIRLVETFINLFKGNGYQKDKFEEFRQINESSDDGFFKEKHRLFLEIVEDIYDYYYEYLKKHDAIDFNDMINDATNILQENDFYKDYRYIMVDEFQDTSHTRFNFLKTLKNKLNSKLIVVGDDWQSIYQFTGCDIDLFTNFENYFEDSKTEICYITNTYRNSQSLIDVSGNFIMKNESQFVKQLNSKSDGQINDTIKLYQYLNFLEQSFVFEVMINDIYKSSAKNKVKILVLGRNRKDYKALLNDGLFYTSGSLNDKNLRIHYSKNPNIIIRYMTVHGSKGLEEDNVILINLEDKKNGFPNKIEDDSVLSFVKNKKAESIEFAEERRLFYVALTRTKQRTYLLAPKDKASYFVNEILNDIEVVDYEIEHESEVYDDKIRVIASLDKECPHCGTGKINLLFNPRTGKKFFKCSNWPKCDWYGGNFYEEVEALENPQYCPKCGGLLVKKGDMYACMNYFPDKACTFKVNIEKD